MKKIAIACSSILVLIIGCDKKEKIVNSNEVVPDTTEVVVIDEHNAKNSLDYIGMYKGIVPCADCEGIETTLWINENNYVLLTNYLGKKNKAETESRGAYVCNNEGNTIILEGIENAPNRYFVGENYLKQLDMDGNKICSNAFYLDRNFNASQFIQSVDRIHRIGIRETPHVYVLITKDSMDERVQSRLDLKINAMIELLNDTSLKPYTSADSSLESENFMFDESSDISITEDDKKYLIDEFYSK
jgi:uncharacterized lipoprotein NlpE involved in copper resistance